MPPLLLHQTTRLIIAAVKKTGIRIRVVRMSSGGSSHSTLCDVQFEKNCLWIPVMNPSVKVFGQKQPTSTDLFSVHFENVS
ncbi:hypothetical protein FKM82_019502 [Ascaphus truei]